MTPATRTRLRKTAVAGHCVLIALCTAWALFESTVPIANIQWRDGLSPEARRQAERELYVEEYLDNGNEGHYSLWSPRRSDIAALVAHPDVADTHRISRQDATLTKESYRGTRRIWWGGPFKGKNSAVHFRVALIVIGFVTVLCASLAAPRPRVYLRRVITGSDR
ncbi:MAG: hypothetical protein O2930_10035 [Acidobacteria bacterium]|nr:hypothetical protein [Acidobacteriota bacterium]